MAVQVPMIDAAGISAALPMGMCIDVMEDALRALDRDAVAQPLRSVIHLPDRSGSLYTMPAFIEHPRALAVKLITIFNGNEAGPLPTHQGIVVVFDARTGRPSLLLDAARLTAIRTAAVSAAATRALALPGAAVAAILGTGVQARSHMEALPLVRPIRQIRVWGRNRERAEQLVRDVADAAFEVVTCDSAADAVAGADVICTTTSAREPVLRGEWLKRGAHINAIGASTADTREVDSAAVAMSRIFVDSVDAALMEAGDLLIPAREDLTDGTHWVPIGAVLSGSVPGRRTEEEITLFKSVGLAIEDAAAAAYVAQQLSVSGEA